MFILITQSSLGHFSDCLLILGFFHLNAFMGTMQDIGRGMGDAG